MEQKTKRSRRRIRSGDTEMITESSSCSESEKKHNKSKTAMRRSSARLSKGKKGVDSSTSIDSAYDGDGETTCSASEVTQSSSSSSDNMTSSPSSDMYDFDEDDGPSNRGILSPKQPKVKKKSKHKPQQAKQTKKNSKTGKATKNPSKTEKTMKTPTVTPVISKSKSNIENKPARKPKGIKTPGVSPIPCNTSSRLDSPLETPTEKRGKRKTPIPTPNITPYIGSKTKNPRIDAIKNDSGVFVSPPPQKIARLLAKDTSTPSASVKDTKADKCFGFDSVGSPAYGTTTSDYGSAVMDISQISMDDSVPSGKDFEVTMFSEPETVPEADISLNKSISNSYKPSRQKRPKGRYSVGKLDAWAEKMNQEFDDAEHFELSIEG